MAELTNCGVHGVGYIGACPVCHKLALTKLAEVEKELGKLKLALDGGDVVDWKDRAERAESRLARQMEIKGSLDRDLDHYSKVLRKLESQSLRDREVLWEMREALDSCQKVLDSAIPETCGGCGTPNAQCDVSCADAHYLADLYNSVKKALSLTLTENEAERRIKARGMLMAADKAEKKAYTELASAKEIESDPDENWVSKEQKHYQVAEIVAGAHTLAILHDDLIADAKRLEAGDGSGRDK